MTNRSRPFLAAIALAGIALTSSSHAAVEAHVEAHVEARSTADRVNVRSRPGYVGEPITHLQQGQSVRVLGTNLIDRPSPGEPNVWYRIELPSTASLWVASDYVDAASRTVIADVLNVRAGPGYDYATVARVSHGTVLETRGDLRDGWLEIAAPPDAHGFVPARFLTLDPLPTTVAATVPIPSPAPPPTPAPAPDRNPTATAATAATATATPPATPPPPTPSVLSTNDLPPAIPQVRITPIAQTPASPQVTAVPPPATPAEVPPSRPVAGLDTTPAPSPASPQTSHSPVPTPAPDGPKDYAWFRQFIDSRAATPRSAPEPVVVPADSILPEAPAQTAPDASFQADPADARSEDSRPPDTREARWVRREGLVVRPLNFAAPTFQALQARDSGKFVNFLFSSGPEPIPWTEYHGRVVIVTGREYLDRRTYWRGIPVLDVEAIEAVR